MMLPIITEKEFCEHIEDDDFPILYGNPVFIYTNDGRLLVCMTFKLYERLLKRKEQIEGVITDEKTGKYPENLENRAD